MLRVMTFPMALILWPFRLLLYGVMAWLGISVLMPLAPNEILGIVISAPTAALAIGIDLLVSSRLRKRPLGEEAVNRGLIIDHLLSEPGQSIADRRARELEGAPVVEAELEEAPDRPMLPPSSRG
jgi:hypothetical protein